MPNPFNAWSCKASLDGLAGAGWPAGPAVTPTAAIPKASGCDRGRNPSNEV